MVCRSVISRNRSSSGGSLLQQHELQRPIGRIQVLTRSVAGGSAHHRRAPARMDFECNFDDDESVKAAAALFAEQAAGVDLAAVAVEVVSGGITNKLKKVVYPGGQPAVLVRIFGAEGMIDRDEEDPLFEAICGALGEPRYYGRFKNGRVEGWLDGCRPLALDDMADAQFSPNIAAKMARLHKFDGIPPQFRAKYSAPGMWAQLDAWYAEAVEPRTAEAVSKRPADAVLLATLDLGQAKAELAGLKAAIPVGAPVGFCHNDLLCGNIMVNEATAAITLIDFEYGGTNFRGFDIANHFNEWAGGTDDQPDGSYLGYRPGVSDYGRFPSAAQQRVFCEAYLAELDGAPPPAAAVTALLAEASQFVLVNHWYWGLWAINQARDEGCEAFPYLTYACSRIGEYYKKKAAQS
jgi:ethanolamine kinase